jgi:hypothetical protein
VYSWPVAESPISNLLWLLSDSLRILLESLGSYLVRTLPARHARSEPSPCDSTSGRVNVNPPFLPLLQTIIAIDITTAGITVATFVYLLNRRREDCERFAQLKSDAPPTIPYGYDDISFTAWKLRLDIYLAIMYTVLFLLAAPPSVALILMWDNQDKAHGLYRLLVVTTGFALFLVLATFGNLWASSKRRALPPQLRAF